eukprot:scaffold3522_cov100-Isochrysis_galbana.AAC.3
MELTEDYHERSSLFGIKTLFQFLGYAAAPALGLGLAAAYGDDLVALYGVQSIVFGVLGLLAYVVRTCAPCSHPWFTPSLHTPPTLSSHPPYPVASAPPLTPTGQAPRATPPACSPPPPPLRAP